MPEETLEIFNNLIDYVKDTAPEIARNENHEGIAMLIVNGEVEVYDIHTNPRDAMPQILNENQPDAYVLITEVRFLSIPLGQEDVYLGPDYQTGEIANNLDNPSALMISAAMRGSTFRHLMAEASTERFPRDFKDWEEADSVTGTLAINNW